MEWLDISLKEKKRHSLITIGNFIVEFLHIHPFQDGNGCISRVITNLLLLQAGYLYIPYVSHEKIIEDLKTEYYLALRKSQKTFNTKKTNINHWLDFFLTILLEQSRQAILLLSNEKIEKFLSPKQLQVWKYLNTIEEAAPIDIEKSTKNVRSTINQVLEKLLSLNKN